MASEKKFVDFVCDQMRGAGRISSLKMFGEYAVYCGEKVVALVCDNQLFIRPSAGGRAFIGTPTEAAPFPGAKPHFLIDEQLDDGEWLAGLVLATAREMPVPKPKKPKKLKKTPPPTRKAAKKAPAKPARRK